jgi:hypothetical protein
MNKSVRLLNSFCLILGCHSKKTFIYMFFNKKNFWALKLLVYLMGMVIYCYSDLTVNLQ